MTDERQHKIDRMVDGELAMEARRDLLLQCDEKSQWRDLALAYVESQTLSGELKSFVAESTVAKQTYTPDKSGTAEKSWGPWALAAGLLLALGFGYGAGTWWQSSGVGTANVAVAPTDGSETTELLKPESMQFMVGNPGTNEMQQVQLPIVNASDLQPGWEDQLRPGIPDELRRELRSGGIDMQQMRTVMPVRLQDGRRVIVPIDYYIERPFQ